MFNVNVQPKVLKSLKNEGYTFEFESNKVIVRTREGKFSFGIIYKEDTYELLVFSKTGYCYATNVEIIFDRSIKSPVLNTSEKHNDTTRFRTIICC